INGLSMLIKSMSYEHYSSNTFRTYSCDLYLKLFFLKLSEAVHSDDYKKVSSHYDKLAIIRSKIYNKPYNDWDIDWLSHELAMSKSYFQHLYKKTFGVSAMDDVIQSRIEHAKYLLSTTDLPVNQIAQLCGYKCDLHFMRQFKSRINQTPTQYRNALSKH
ncbi:MAG: helix-turn-helix transcriptional regulator, partial [Oscillospiraceae bacterium]|nr:helix-turn-helix transcriptional regulator [Oscillospiraceae bacterium]